MMNTVYVSNLPKNFREESVYSLFEERCGQVKEVSLTRRYEDSVATVRFVDPLGFEKALSLEDSISIDGGVTMLKIDLRAPPREGGFDREGKGRKSGKGGYWSEGGSWKSWDQDGGDRPKGGHKWDNDGWNSGGGRDGRWDGGGDWQSGGASGSQWKESSSPGGKGDGRKAGGKSPPSEVVWIGNLPPNITEDEIDRECQKYGKVTLVRLKGENRDRAFAFVTFSSISAATRAVEDLHRSKPFDSQAINAFYATIRDPENGKKPASLRDGRDRREGLEENEVREDRTRRCDSRGPDDEDVSVRRDDPPKARQRVLLLRPNSRGDSRGGQRKESRDDIDDRGKARPGRVGAGETLPSSSRPKRPAVREEEDEEEEEDEASGRARPKTKARSTTSPKLASAASTAPAAAASASTAAAASQAAGGRERNRDRESSAGLGYGASRLLPRSTKGSSKTATSRRSGGDPEGTNEKGARTGNRAERHIAQEEGEEEEEESEVEAEAEAKDAESAESEPEADAEAEESEQDAKGGDGADSDEDDARGSGRHPEASERERAAAAASAIAEALPGKASKKAADSDDDVLPSRDRERARNVPTDDRARQRSRSRELKTERAALARDRDARDRRDERDSTRDRRADDRDARGQRDARDPRGRDARDVGASRGSAREVRDCDAREGGRDARDRTRDARDARENRRESDRRADDHRDADRVGDRRGVGHREDTRKASSPRPRSRSKVRAGGSPRRQAARDALSRDRDTSRGHAGSTPNGRRGASSRAADSAEDRRRTDDRVRADERRRSGDRGRDADRRRSASGSIVSRKKRAEPRKLLRLDNLPGDMTREELIATAADFGEVSDAKMSKKVLNGARSAVVEFVREADVEVALRKLDRRRVEGWEQRLKATIVEDP